MDINNLKTIISQGENEKIEFKTKRTTETHWSR